MIELILGYFWRNEILLICGLLLIFFLSKPLGEFISKLPPSFSDGKFQFSDLPNAIILTVYLFAILIPLCMVGYAIYHLFL